MNYNKYPQISPKSKFIQRVYVSIMLFVVGRAIAAAAKTDKVVKEEFKNLRDDFIMRLGVTPNGPEMILGKDDKGQVKYMGWNSKGKKITMNMQIKNLEAAMLMFTFQESTTMATARDRLSVGGDLPDACAFVRILDIVETYLLPKIIVKLAVKRYPKWSQMSPARKYVGRVLVYTRTLLGI